MYTAQEQSMIDQANAMGKHAVGNQFTIKLAESGRANKVTVSGTIVECGFGYFDKTPTMRGTRISAIFKVVLEVGPNKIRREFHVKRVPQ
jgi:hypothetical protein